MVWENEPVYDILPWFLQCRGLNVCFKWHLQNGKKEFVKNKDWSRIMLNKGPFQLKKKMKNVKIVQKLQKMEFCGKLEIPSRMQKI